MDNNIEPRVIDADAQRVANDEAIDMLRDSKDYSMKQKIEACRQGWPLVWDAFKAALLGREIFAVPREVTFIVKVKVPDGHEVNLDIVQSGINLGEYNA